jgi:hypothetical protein
LRDESYSVLLEFVRFEYLSLDTIRDFTQLISDSFSLLTSSIWRSLIPRLTLSVSPSPFLSDRIRCRLVPFCADRPLDGIVSFLTRKFGGNIHDLGVVEVSASSQNWPRRRVSVIVDFRGTLSCFATQDVANSWICINFKTRGIRASHYSIQTRTDSDSNLPRSWVLEGSDDRENWTIFDTRQANNELTGIGCVKTFSIANPRFVRLIRIRQTGPSSSSNDMLILQSLEFFGSIRE